VPVLRISAGFLRLSVDEAKPHLMERCPVGEFIAGQALASITEEDIEMPRIVGIHHLELKPGVEAQEFERFFRDKWLVDTSGLPGMTTSLLKGDKGKRDGKYLMMFEFDNPDSRDQLFVDEAKATEEVKRLWQRWKELVTFVSSEFTDYVEL
jgi:hypothetical protein